MTTEVVHGEFDTDEDSVPSIFITDNAIDAKYSDRIMIVCRAPLGNNHICGKRYRNLPTFVRHLEKPNVHGLRVGD